MLIMASLGVACVLVTVYFNIWSAREYKTELACRAAALTMPKEDVLFWIEQSPAREYALYAQTNEAPRLVVAQMSYRDDLRTVYEQVCAAGYTVLDTPGWLQSPDGVPPPSLYEQWEEPGRSLSGVIGVAMAVSLLLALIWSGLKQFTA